MVRKKKNPETLVNINGIEVPVNDVWIWELYKFKCLLCGRGMVCLHEIPPKSKNSLWRRMPETRFPVCSQHHEQLHNMNWRAALTLVTGLRNAYFPQALLEIEKHKIKYGEDNDGR